MSLSSYSYLPRKCQPHLFAMEQIGSYLSEGFNSINPGQTAWIKSFGTVAFSFGSPTGITFTYSVAVTGSITIVVKAKY
jgi:hypothetical protein